MQQSEPGLLSARHTLSLSLGASNGLQTVAIQNSHGSWGTWEPHGSSLKGTPRQDTQKGKKAPLKSTVIPSSSAFGQRHTVHPTPGLAAPKSVLLTPHTQFFPFSLISANVYRVIEHIIIITG